MYLLVLLPAMTISFVCGYFTYKWQMAREVTKWLRKNGIDPNNFRLKVQNTESPGLSRLPRNKGQN